MKRITDKYDRVITYVSDRGAGLVAAFDKVYPGNPHLFCYFHLKKNLRSRITGKGSNGRAKNVLNAFFLCAYSSTEKEYYYNLKGLRKEGGDALIDGFLKDLPLEHWCRAFAVGCRFGIMANTVAESFNSWIDVERGLPVYSMLESVRVKQMAMSNERRTEAEQCTTVLTSSMEGELEEKMYEGRRFQVIKSYRGVYEVRGKYSYQVNLNEFSCSCVKWQINSFPCAHALSAIMFSKLDVYKFIHPVYHASSFRLCYAVPINPIPNVDQEFVRSSEKFIQPPLVRTPPGRPRKKRFRSAYEVPVKRQMICGRCKKSGNHNKTTCCAPIS